MKKCLSFSFFLILIVGQFSFATANNNPPSLSDLRPEKVMANNVEVFYLNGKPYTGTTYDEFSGNQQCREITFVNGLKQKEKGWYLESGNLEREFSYKDGVKHGKFVGYYDDGKTKYFEENYVNGLQEGTQSGWNSDGSLRYQEQRASGVKIMRVEYEKKGVWPKDNC